MMAISMNRLLMKWSVGMIVIVMVLLAGNTPQAMATDPHANAALDWLEKQLAPVPYPVSIAFDSSYGSSYVGNVSGTVSVSSLPSGYTTRTLPHIETLATYPLGYSGTVSGTWGGGLGTLSDYKAFVFDYTDIGYFKKSVNLNPDGTWSAGSVTFLGTPMVALIKNGTIFVTEANQPVTQVVDGYEVWVYSVNGTPALQTRVPVKTNGTFETHAFPSFDGTNFLGWWPAVLAGDKFARVVHTSNEKMMGTTEEHRLDLIRSYYVPLDDPFYNLEIDRRSWIYDDALAIIAFTAAGDQTRASAILDTLKSLQNTDGSLYLSYDVYAGFQSDTTVRSGSLAWVGYAETVYENAFSDNTYRDLAVNAANYLLTMKNTTTGSIKGGPDVSWYSTEHNIDSYFFFRDLAILTGSTTYSNAATDVKDALLNYHWNTSENRFNQGIGDTEKALDAGSWGALFLQAIGRSDLDAYTASYLSNFAVSGSSMVLSSGSTDYNMSYQTTAALSGYKPYDAVGAPSIVWTEGTWGVITYFMRSGTSTTGLVNSMKAMHDADPKGGLVYSNQAYIPYPYEYHVWPAVAASAWEYITLTDSNLVFAP
ncbi:hypothetical protein [Cohnella sp. WQ 127256]|uniref:hypothetical protein n=1 Tax=Cohnella sp. WQ 127256 TaxID=2938790 RepID=UPI00211881C0|nr:hypothetical protein [Cohnella sp. WQ 127256]